MKPQVATAPNAAPVPSAAIDRELARRVRNFLASKNVPGLRHLEVEVHGESVVISGRTKTFYEKQLASACCQRVAGVRHVCNRVVVDHSTVAKDPGGVEPQIYGPHRARSRRKVPVR